MHALTIKMITPSATRPAKVRVFSHTLNKSYVYNHELTLEENAETCAKQFVIDMNWQCELIIGSVIDGSFVGVVVPERYLKARDAVLATRFAMARGDLHGNPHCKVWGQQVSELTDGILSRSADSFSAHYAAYVAKVKVD